MNPVVGVAWRVCEALKLAHGFGKHRGVVLFADHPVSEFVPLQHRRCQPPIAESPAALPAHRIGDATSILSVDYLLQTRDDVRLAMIAKLDHDPAAAHLVGDCASCPRTSE